MGASLVVAHRAGDRARRQACLERTCGITAVQRGLELRAAAGDLPLARALGVLVVIDETDEGYGLVLHVENERLAAGGLVEPGERLTIAEHSDVPHVDQHLALGKAVLRALRILGIARVQVARLQAPDRLDVLEPLHAPSQLIDLRHAHPPMIAPETCAGSPSMARSEGGCRPSTSRTPSSAASSAAYQVRPERSSSCESRISASSSLPKNSVCTAFAMKASYSPGCSRMAICERSVSVSGAHSDSAATWYFLRSTAMSAAILSVPALPAPYAGPCM